MVWSYDIKRRFILMCDPHSKMKPIVKEVLSSLLPTLRAGEGDCDITGSDQNILIYQGYNIFF